MQVETTFIKNLRHTHTRALARTHIPITAQAPSDRKNEYESTKDNIV